MIPRSAVDPELHLLRSAIRALDGRERQQAEGARFGLYSAFEMCDAALARRWSSALRVALLVAPDESVRASALAALDAIDRAIGV